MTTSISVERRRLGARRALLALSTILCSGLSAPALAESAHPNLDANGVDLVDGSFNLRLPVASIGSGQAALPLVVYSERFDNWSQVSIYQEITGGVTLMTVNLGTGFDRFSSADGFTASKLGTGATLTFSGASVIYTTLDGTTIEFDNPSPNAGNGGASKFCDSNNAQYCYYLPANINRRGGMTVSYEWDVVPNCSGQRVVDGPEDCNEYWRLGSVSNDAGYSITWDYVNPTGSPVTAWFQPKHAVFSNSNAASSTTPTVTYTYPSYTTMTVTTPGGKTWRISGSPGQVTAVRRPSASSDTTIVSRSGGVVSAVTRDGVTTSYSRSVSGSTATTVITDPLSHASTVAADLTRQRVTSVTDPLSRTTTMSYDGVGRPTEIAYPEGNKVQYGYDGRGNLTTTTQVAKSGSGLANIVTSATFAAFCTDASCNEPITTTDARGNVTDYGYDGATGLPTSITAPAASSGAVRPQIRYSYTTVSGVSMPTGISSCQTSASCTHTADEVATTIGYDANLNTTSVSKGAGDGSLTATTTSSYDAVGNLLTVDGPLAGSADTTTYRWSADREALGVISADPDGSGPLKRRATRTTYNADGQPSVTEAGTVNGTSDGDWAAFASLQQSTASYDGNARKISDTLSAGGTTYAVTQYGYDALGRLECSAQRMNPAAWSSLPASACSLGSAGSYGADRIVRNSYDAAGEATKVQSAYGTADQADEASGSYNANGTLASLTDANGNVTSYGYDGFDRLSTTTYPGGSYEQLGHDANGNVTSRRLRDGNVIGFSYDALNRVTAKDLPNLATYEFDIGYSYDLLGRLTRAQDSNTHFAALGWDALGRQVSEQSNFSTRGFAYDLAGRRTRMGWGDGSHIDYGYDTTGNMTSLTDSGGVTVATFGYDDLGRRTSLTRGNGVTTTYGYDGASRLASQSLTFPNASSNLALTFAYNPAGQIVSGSRSNDAYAWTGAVNVDRPYAVNALNQYTSAGATSFGYDGRGNLTASGSSSYGYTSENRLASAPGATLAYDPLGRLHYDSADNPGQALQYDGDHLIAEVSNGFDKRYAWGPGADEPLVEYAGGTRTWLVADERGSIVARTDASGTVTAINRYDEYGIPQSTNVGRFQYTGQAWLAGLGMSYYKARMYSPTLGRFMQTDPIGYADGANWYNYVGSDPVNAIDAAGLQVTSGPAVNTTCPGCTIDTAPTLTANLGPFPSNGGGGGVFGDVAALLFGGSNFAGGIVRSLIMPAEDGGGGGGDGGSTQSNQPCPTGRRISYGLGPSATLFAGIVGISAGVSGNISFPVSSRGPSLRGAQLSITGSVTPLIGLGAFLAAGPSGSASSSNTAASTLSGSITPVLQGGGSDGYGVEVVRAINGDPLDWGGSGGRIGAGGYGAVGARFSGTITSPQLGCKNGK